MVVDRRVPTSKNATETRTLEFGVSGFLLNSVVVVYDRTDNALWSQLLGEAISGPLAGVQLTPVDFEILSWREFREAHPGGLVVGYDDTGLPNMYASRRAPPLGDHSRMLFDVPAMGTRLRPKELGLGIRAGSRAIFVTRRLVLEEPIQVETELGVVEVRSSSAGVYAENIPDGVTAAQTYYFGWSAFYPETEIIDIDGG